MKNLFLLFALCSTLISSQSCKNNTDTTPTEVTSKASNPSDVIPFMDKFKILLGNGETVKDLVNYKNNDFFYTNQEGGSSWVVYKTPNSGITSKTSSNTRTELHELQKWTPATGANLTGTLKVQHISATSDARVGAGFSVVVGQIHSGEGHKNEPLKIFYKKYPGHTKGAVFWNYEINTAGKNSGRWDYSTTVWGYDMAYVGKTTDHYPPEPEDGIALGEEFSYEINIFKGIMHLTFYSEGHPTRTFTKSLISSDFATTTQRPQQVTTLYKGLGRDGVERPEAYAGEWQYFKQGAYNQVNGKEPEKNFVWNGGAAIYGGCLLYTSPSPRDRG